MARLRENKAAFEAMKILKSWNEAPGYPFGRSYPDRAWTTLEEERQEVLGAVLESVAADSRDPARTAADLDLLRHVAWLGLHETRVRVS